MIILVAIASILTNTLGILVFLFILWMRLKEDFASEIIFKLGFNTLIGICLGVLISNKFLRPYFLWFGFMGGLIGMLTTVLKFKSKFFEIFEAFIVSVLPWMGFVFLNDSVMHYSLSSFLGFIAILVLIFVSYYLSAHYKNFNWYKSGKIGFTGITILGLIFIIRFMLAIFGISVLSFVSNFEAVISGVGFLICLSLLVYLTKTKE